MYIPYQVHCTMATHIPTLILTVNLVKSITTVAVVVAADHPYKRQETYELSTPCCRLSWGSASNQCAKLFDNNEHLLPSFGLSVLTSLEVRPATTSSHQMDLSLRGSQINLAARHKPKSTSVKYPTLQRPCSANVSRHIRTTSSLLRRPMSADEKLARSLRNCVKFSEQVMSEEQLWKNKKFMSNSSSNILKLLLDEPISRSYYSQDTTESLSDSSLGQRICEIASKQEQEQQSTKCADSSESDSNFGEGQNRNKDMIEDNVDSKIRHDTSFDKHSMLNNAKPYLKTSTVPKLTNNPNQSSDFWHDSKPDLPGRVSFGKTEISPESNEFYTDPFPFDVSNSSKKCVHFKESDDADESQNDSHTSSCDSNGTYNIHHSTPTKKCPCPLNCSSSGYVTLAPNDSCLGDSKTHTMTEKEPNLIIEDYKKAIENDESRTHLEFKMAMDKTPNATSSPDTSTDRIISNYKKLANQIFEDIQADLVLSADKTADNTAPEPNQSTLRLSKPKNNSFDDEEKSDNSTNSSMNQFENLRHFQESSSTVIKNYLRSTETKSAPSNHRRVKENNIGANKTGNKSDKNRRVKSANTTMAKGPRKSASATKKTSTYSCLRQDSNLDEFQIEKVDSWMSLYDGNDEFRDSPEIERSDSKSQKTKAKSILKNKGSVEELAMKSSEDSSQDDSTYEEIVSVIKEIEEDKKKENTATRSDVHLKLEPAALRPESKSLATSMAERDQSPDKYRDILHYLDNVESSCDKTIMETRRSIPESSRSEVEFAIEPDIAEDVPKIADLLMLPNHQLARRIVALSLRANELANAIQLSKQHVAHIRLERQKALRQEKSNSTNRLKEQKKYYESIVARHQGFIEQLLKDKGSLCEKVAGLTRRIDSQNQAWEHKLETELTRARETALAGEKIRREKWIRDNTKKIKELTVKGLELEINRMTCEHQKAITELKRKHQQEILDIFAEERQKYEQLEKSIRETCAQDREETISKERDAIRERYEKQLRDEQNSFDEQKSKLLEEFTAERERICLEMKQKELEFESKKQEMIKEKDIDIEQVYAEFNEKLSKQEQKYQARINTMEKQFESDFLIWKREFENACKLREVESENAIRQHYRSERDRQIDAIVAKMDSETQKCQDEYEIKLCRFKEKYDSELHQVENAEKQLKEKFHDARNKLAESEARVQNYQAEVKQLNMELNHCKKMCDKLLEEKEIVKEHARHEVQHEIATIQAERDNEIEKIYQRVQQAIDKKDTAMDLLQKENGSLRERCIKLEAIIRQQRKDYCIK